jgi:transcriptional regulator with XRE-family HTH domain
MNAGPSLSIGERVAFYRRRRGLTQQTLAGLVGRTSSWVEKIENGRAPIDRISVVRDLAGVLGVSFHDLVPDDPPAGRREVPRELTLDYRAVNPRLAVQDGNVATVGVAELRRLVDDVWTAYQDSRWRYVVMRLNQLLPAAYLATQRDDPYRTATRSLAHLYHVAASLLVKLGDPAVARLCAERGDIAAREVGDAVTITSLQRGVAHALLSCGHYEDAVAVVRDGLVEGGELTATPARLSVTGTLMFVGATACARAGERSEAMAFLRHADRLAQRLGRDGNEVWTAFGPTNVAIHRVTVAAELGDVRQAADLGVELDVSSVPRERRVRHQLEVARAQWRLGRADESLQAVLEAEFGAPEQVRRHFLTHELVDDWLRATRSRPDHNLVALARRVGHAA